MKRVSLAIIIALSAATICVAQENPIDKAGYKLAQLLYFVDNLYVDTTNVEEMTDAAIHGILESLDPHSSYIPSKDVEAANEDLQGNFEGIGIRYMFMEDTVCIDQTITGCPAEKVGMLPGDRIIAVDGKTIAGVKIKRNDVPKMLRGPRGTTVNLIVVRRGEKEPLHFKVTRDKIPLNSVDAAFYVAPGIGYIKINSFSFTTTDEVNTKIEELQKTGTLSKLVIDLQSNGGGVMYGAVDLVDHFLPADRLIVYTQGEHQRRSEARSTRTSKKLTDIDLAILIDEHSASASEIAAGALQDWDRATIIGRRSFGKGLVQRPLRLNDGSEVRLTIARYYTPSGRNIQKPYDKGADKYHKDLENRYKHGEFAHSDSISFPDSLKYTTLIEKRTVYGGGGIFPDIFVPLDTTRYSTYYRTIVAKGVFNTTISDYIDKNRKSLLKKYPDFASFNSEFEVPQSIIFNMINNANKEKIEYNEAEFKQSEPILRKQIKAVIAQSLYGTNYYFEVMQSENDALQQAIKLFTNK